METITLFRLHQLKSMFLGSTDCIFEIVITTSMWPPCTCTYAYTHTIYYKLKYTDNSLRCPGVTRQANKIRAIHKPHLTTTGSEKPGLLSWPHPACGSWFWWGKAKVWSKHEPLWNVAGRTVFGSMLGSSTASLIRLLTRSRSKKIFGSYCVNRCTCQPLWSVWLC